MATGDVIKLGTLYVGGNEHVNPGCPWQNGYAPDGAPKGDVPVYSGGNIEIRDTDNSNDYYKIKWVEVNDHGKKLLIADRNLLVSVSWDELNKQGLIFGKKITIDGKEYLCRVMTGGSNYRTDTNAYFGGSPKENEWDRFICNEDKIDGLPIPTSTDLDSTQNDADRLGTHNSKWHWYCCRSWCQETYTKDYSQRVLRGYESPRSFICHSRSNTSSDFGWRPVLEPITSKPKYLGKVQLGSLYHNGSPQPVPTRPWHSGTYPGNLSERGNGNIPMCSNDFSNWTLGNTSSSNELTWIKIQDNNKTLFICDEVILTDVSWYELDKQGLVFGKKITIDGKDYICRLLTGGNNYRIGTNGYFGCSPKENEWDRFITNEENIEGLPIPTSTDLDNTIDYTDLDGEHNQLWHWWGIRSWCQETYTKDYSQRVLRGYESPRYSDYYYSSYTYNHSGWRPVLEPINPVNIKFTNDSSVAMKGDTAMVGTSHEYHIGITILLESEILKPFTVTTYIQGSGTNILRNTVSDVLSTPGCTSWFSADKFSTEDLNLAPGKYEYIVTAIHPEGLTFTKSFKFEVLPKNYMYLGYTGRVPQNLWLLAGKYYVRCKGAGGGAGQNDGNGSGHSDAPGTVYGSGCPGASAEAEFWIRPNSGIKLEEIYEYFKVYVGEGGSIGNDISGCYMSRDLTGGGGGMTGITHIENDHIAYPLVAGGGGGAGCDFRGYNNTIPNGKVGAPYWGADPSVLHNDVLSKLYFPNGTGQVTAFFDGSNSIAARDYSDSSGGLREGSHPLGQHTAYTGEGGWPGGGSSGLGGFGGNSSPRVGGVKLCSSKDTDYEPGTIYEYGATGCCNSATTGRNKFYLYVSDFYQNISGGSPGAIVDANNTNTWTPSDFSKFLEVHKGSPGSLEILATQVSPALAGTLGIESIELRGTQVVCQLNVGDLHSPNGQMSMTCLHSDCSLYGQVNVVLETKSKDEIESHTTSAYLGNFFKVINGDDRTYFRCKTVLEFKDLAKHLNEFLTLRVRVRAFVMTPAYSNKELQKVKDLSDPEQTKQAIVSNSPAYGTETEWSPWTFTQIAPTDEKAYVVNIENLPISCQLSRDTSKHLFTLKYSSPVNPSSTTDAYYNIQKKLSEKGEDWIDVYSSGTLISKNFQTTSLDISNFALGVTDYVTQTVKYRVRLVIPDVKLGEWTESTECILYPPVSLPKISSFQVPRYLPRNSTIPLIPPGTDMDVTLPEELKDFTLYYTCDFFDGKKWYTEVSTARRLVSLSGLKVYLPEVVTAHAKYRFRPVAVHNQKSNVVIVGEATESNEFSTALTPEINVTYANDSIIKFNIQAPEGVESIVQWKASIGDRISEVHTENLNGEQCYYIDKQLLHNGGNTLYIEVLDKYENITILMKPIQVTAIPPYQVEDKDLKLSSFISFAQAGVENFTPMTKKITGIDYSTAESMFIGHGNLSKQVTLKMQLDREVVTGNPILDERFSIDSLKGAIQ